MKKQDNIKSNSEPSNHQTKSQIKGIRKENPFVVPENYFDDLPSLIQQKIQRNEPTKVRRIGLVRAVVYTSSVAAAIVALFFVFTFLVPKKEVKDTQVASFSDYKDAIAAYLEENLDEATLLEVSSDNLALFDPNELSAVVRINDTIEQKQNEDTKFAADTTLHADDILEYLINENIDPETL